MDANYRLSMKCLHVVCMDRKHKRLVGFALHLDEQLVMKESCIENSMRSRELDNVPLMGSFTRQGI